MGTWKQLEIELQEEGLSFDELWGWWQDEYDEEASIARSEVLRSLVKDGIVKGVDDAVSNVTSLKSLFGLTQEYVEEFVDAVTEDLKYELLDKPLSDVPAILETYHIFLHELKAEECLSEKFVEATMNELATFYAELKNSE